MWDKIKSFFSRCWEFAKKIPAKGFIFLLLMGAVVYWVIRKFFYQKQIQEIQNERNYEKERVKEIIASIEEEEKKKIEEVNNEYKYRLEELDQREEEINKALSEGPKALALRWKEYLSQ